MIERHSSRYCKICKLIRRKGVITEHCKDCDVCIEELDHHCPWSSKCIGKNNIKPFYVFVISLVIHLIVTIIAAMFVGAISIE